jgi:hypothetical protein
MLMLPQWVVQLLLPAAGVTAPSWGGISAATNNTAANPLILTIFVLYNLWRDLNFHTYTSIWRGVNVCSFIQQYLRDLVIDFNKLIISAAWVL